MRYGNPFWQQGLQCLCVCSNRNEFVKRYFCTEETPVFSLHIPTESYVGGSTNTSMNVVFFLFLFFFCSSVRSNWVHSCWSTNQQQYILCTSIVCLYFQIISQDRRGWMMSFLALLSLRNHGPPLQVMIMCWASVFNTCNTWHGIEH